MTLQHPQTSSGNGYSRGALRCIDAVTTTVVEALKPPPILTLSQWAERYAYLSPETSAKGGKYRAFGYQVGMMDAITDPAVRQVTVMKSARVGYTKILDHVAGYFIHQDPSPVLIVQPRVEDAEDYSRTEIAPMLRDTPVLAEIAGDLKAKDSQQRILKRVFRNGSSISFVGANSPGGFRRITARVVAFDEVDGYPPDGAGEEGDQIALGTKRTETFWNRKIILGSTPTVKGVSRIEKAFARSDQRRYFVPCPQCGHRQTIKWSSLQWDQDEETGEHLPETVHMVCEASGCIIEEHHKPWMVDNGEWIPTAVAQDASHAGFHIWAGYSLFPNASWPNLVAEWLRVYKDPHLLRTFNNLVLGETWEDAGERVSEHDLLERLEDWGPHAPPGVMKVVLGIDTQPDRLEIERLGVGVGEETWSLDFKTIYGDPQGKKLWEDLDAYRAIPTITADGRKLSVAAVCIDSGGANTQAVYAYCRERGRDRVWAIKGVPGPSKPIWPKKASRSNRGKINLFAVGVDSAKESIYARLRIQEPGPGYCHFPAGRDVDYFKQLTAETVMTRFKKGFAVREWVKKSNQRNEGLDCRVYAYAAFLSLGVNWGREMRAAEFAPRVKVEAVPLAEAVTNAEPVPVAQASPPAPAAPVPTATATVTTAQPTQAPRRLFPRHSLPGFKPK
ncbi:MAG: phage terminase large subunit family protein [Alsobacter sp.]